MRIFIGSQLLIWAGWLSGSYGYGWINTPLALALAAIGFRFVWDDFRPKEKFRPTSGHGIYLDSATGNIEIKDCRVYDNRRHG